MQYRSFLWLKYSFPITFTIFSFVSFCALLRCPLLKQAVFCTAANKCTSFSALPFFSILQNTSMTSQHCLHLKFFIIFHLHFQHTCTHLYPYVHIYTQTCEQTHMYAHINVCFMKAGIFICLIYCHNSYVYNSTWNIFSAQQIFT